MVYQELCASVECMINLPALNYLLLVKITKPPHCCLSFHTSQSPEAWCFDPCVHDTQRIHLSFSYEPSSESHAESHSESHTESHTESSPPNVFSNGQWMHESHSDFNRQNLCDHQPSTWPTLAAVFVQLLQKRVGTNEWKCNTWGCVQYCTKAVRNDTQAVWYWAWVDGKQAQAQKILNVKKFQYPITTSKKLLNRESPILENSKELSSPSSSNSIYKWQVERHRCSIGLHR